MSPKFYDALLRLVSTLALYYVTQAQAVQIFHLSSSDASSVAALPVLLVITINFWVKS